MLLEVYIVGLVASALLLLLARNANSAVYLIPLIWPFVVATVLLDVIDGRLRR